MDCALFTSSFFFCGASFVMEVNGLWFCRKGDASLGVPEPLTKRDTTSLLLLPVLGVPLKVEIVPFSVEVWLFSREFRGGECPEAVGVAVARDILVVAVFWECERWSSRSVITFASAECWRALCFSLPPFGSCSVDAGWE
jgi:hypothetical protein